MGLVGVTHMRTITTFVWTAVLTLMLVVPSHAQVLYGSIVGQVADTTGAIVPGAAVKITQRETNQSRESTSGVTGDFNFPSLPGGTYDVVVSKQGFQTFTSKGVTVAAGQVARVDAALHVGGVSETVTVSSEAALLQT